jgi:hypothetical protein
MKPDVSLPHAQAPPTCPILSHSNPAHASPSPILKIHFNIFSPSTPKLCFLTLLDRAFYPEREQLVLSSVANKQ